MRPLQFGDEDRSLFGIHHSPEPAQTGGLGVVICAPFGHEAIRSHRLFRVLAERLARAGSHVLRFDYYGTGDSGGDDAEGELAGWARDVQSAHRELLRCAAPGQVVWIGARLGASVALQAAQDDTLALPPKLLVFDPIVDGKAYLEAMRVLHVETLEESYSVIDPAWRHRLDHDPQAYLDEAIGFAISPALRGQLAALDAASLTPAPRTAVNVIASPDDEPVQRWVQGLQAANAVDVDAIALQHSLVWTSDDSLNSALVPAEALQAMLAAAGSWRG